MKSERHLFFSILLFVGIMVVGTYAYNFVEGWNMLDSAYFVVITVTTIGYGDLVPITNTGKIFTMFFSFFGVAMAFYFFSIIGGALFKKHVAKKVSEMKREVKKEQEIKGEIKEVLRENIKRRKK